MVVRKSCALSRYRLGDQWCVLWRLRSVTDNLLCDYSCFIYHSYFVRVMGSVFELYAYLNAKGRVADQPWIGVSTVDNYVLVVSL